MQKCEEAQKERATNNDAEINHVERKQKKRAYTAKQEKN